LLKAEGAIGTIHCRELLAAGIEEGEGDVDALLIDACVEVLAGGTSIT